MTHDALSVANDHERDERKARYDRRLRECVSLEFGPTAVVENGRVPRPVDYPDYTKVFVTRQSTKGEGIGLIRQSTVGLTDVLAGLSSDDTRLRDTVLAAIGAK